MSFALFYYLVIVQACAPEAQERKFENEQLKITYSIVTKGQDKVEIRGKIINKRNKMNEPAVGMNLLIKGHPVGTITDETGSFVLLAPVKSGQLIIFFPGYKTVYLKF